MASGTKGSAVPHAEEDLWICRECGWTYPNAHPSAKHRRNHKKVCAGKKVVAHADGGSSDEADSDHEMHPHKPQEHSKDREFVLPQAADDLSESTEPTIPEAQTSISAREFQIPDVVSDSTVPTLPEAQTSISAREFQIPDLVTDSTVTTLPEAQESISTREFQIPESVHHGSDSQALIDEPNPVNAALDDTGTSPAETEVMKSEGALYNIENKSTVPPPSVAAVVAGARSGSPVPHPEEDLWICRECGWTYPNAHPSAKHRRNHKKHCPGKVTAVTSTAHTQGGSSDDEHSDSEAQARQAVDNSKTRAISKEPEAVVRVPEAIPEATSESIKAREVDVPEAASEGPTTKPILEASDNNKAESVLTESKPAGELTGFSSVDTEKREDVTTRSNKQTEADPPSQDKEVKSREFSYAEVVENKLHTPEEVPIATDCTRTREFSFSQPVGEENAVKLPTLEAGVPAAEMQYKSDSLLKTTPSSAACEATSKVGSAFPHPDEDIWICRECGWTYPNAHPSAKHRRNHKKHCPGIAKAGAAPTHTAGGSSDDSHSDHDSEPNHAQDKFKAREFCIVQPAAEIPETVGSSADAIPQAMPLVVEDECNAGELQSELVDQGHNSNLGDLKASAVGAKVTNREWSVEASTGEQEDVTIKNWKPEELAPLHGATKAQVTARECNTAPLLPHDAWICRYCGWTYPNAHPSAKHRRNHKKHCSGNNGASEVHVDGGLSDEAHSDHEV